MCNWIISNYKSIIENISNISIIGLDLGLVHEPNQMVIHVQK